MKFHEIPQFSPQNGNLAKVRTFREKALPADFLSGPGGRRRRRTEIARTPAEPGWIRPARRCAQEQHIPYGYGLAPLTPTIDRCTIDRCTMDSCTVAGARIWDLGFGILDSGFGFGGLGIW